MSSTTSPVSPRSPHSSGVNNASRMTHTPALYTVHQHRRLVVACCAVVCTLGVAWTASTLSTTTNNEANRGRYMVRGRGGNTDAAVHTLLKVWSGGGGATSQIGVGGQQPPQQPVLTGDTTPSVRQRVDDSDTSATSTWIGMWQRRLRSRRLDGRDGNSNDDEQGGMVRRWRHGSADQDGTHGERDDKNDEDDVDVNVNVDGDSRVSRLPLPTHVPCEAWDCTCKGFRAKFGTMVIPDATRRTNKTFWAAARDRGGIREWWVNHQCASALNTSPLIVRPRVDNPKGVKRTDTVSILSFSNGQSYCDENTLLNALYQHHPSGIARIELLMYETSPAPSAFWTAMAATYNSTLPTTPFVVMYRWFNASSRVADVNPPLGTLRNLATLAATGHIMTLMDNDDVYHPDYVVFVVEHMRANAWAHVTTLHGAQALFNPDGTYELETHDDRIIGAHLFTFTDEVSEHCRFQPVVATEERKFDTCLNDRSIPRGHVSVLNTTIKGLGNAFLLTKVSSPMSITNQLWKQGSWSRLTPVDVGTIVDSMARFYRHMHAMQKPIDALPYLPPPVLPDEVGQGNAVTVPVPTKKPGQPSAWDAFHQRHPTFMSPTNYPCCKGFAALPGQYYDVTLGSTVVEPATDAAACCKRCSMIFNATAAKDIPRHATYKDDIFNGFCGGFTFNSLTKMCTLGQGTVRYAPWTWKTHVSGIRISTCGKCGAGLEPIGSIPK
eukprot:m.198017 g.198017  ORF g.198017 m.198017 type:complete len:721 (+) comp20318_c0_seq1:376-2538(+)